MTGAAHAQTGPAAGTQERTASEETRAGAPADDTDASQPQSGGIEDIVVTAQRRSERVQDVPIAISVFSAQQLEAQGITNTLQLGNYVPNLVAQNNTGIGAANAYFLRGLGSTETIATFDPPVGTYVDDIYLSRQNANNLSMFDVERVEVLRGPQGTLFGRNTTGGAISVIMRQPGETLGGFMEAGIGSYHKRMARASVDVPLGEDFGVKLSGYVQNDNGYAKNVTTGERMNDDDGWGVRLGGRASFGGVRWSGSAMRVVNEGENILNFSCNPRDPSDCDGRFLSSGYSEGENLTRFASLLTLPGFRPAAITGRKGRFGHAQRAQSDIFISEFGVDLFEATTLSFITGFVDLSQQFGLDFFDGRSGPSISLPRPPIVGNPRGGFVILNDGEHRQFSQEIKLNGRFGERLDYVAGIYFLNERNRTDFADVFGGSFVLADRVLRNTTRALAGYAQADVHITPEITATAGIRYTDETKKVRLHDNLASCNDGTLEATCLDNANLTAANGRKIPDKLTTRIWTPRFALNYEPSGNLLFFASATKGFKSGGWNARETAPARFLPFGPEKVWSYELGMKSDLLDRRLRANLTLFQVNVSDLQILAGLLNPTTGAINFITRNFADYRNRGVEAELTYQPMPALNLYANLGYQKDKYIVPGGRPAFDEFGIQSVEAQLASCRAALAAGRIPGGTGAAATPACASGIVNPRGEISTPVRTPDWTIALGGSYRIGMGSSGWELMPALNASYRSDAEVAIANFSLYDAPITGSNGTFPANPYGNGAFITGSESRGGWLFNANIALSNPNSPISLSAECNNCLDKTFIQSALSNYSYLNQPATWMVRAKYKF
jgi:iron complex outermembrane receptor protein